MKKIIKEHLKKYVSNIIKENENLYYACDQFKNDRNKQRLCRKIYSQGSWLYDNKQYGLQSIIDEILDPIKKPITKEQESKLKVGTDLLVKIGKISKGHQYYLVKDILENKGLVLVDGKWASVNKLNTNAADLSELVTDLLYKSPKAQPIIEKILENPKNGLMMIKPKLKELLEKYFKKPESFFEYVKNTETRSERGAMAEEQVKETLEDLGFITEYQGGEGDFIDMIFGIDLIMSNSEYGTKTIQVKIDENAWDQDKKYKYIDWIVISNPFTIYDNKTREIVKL